MPWDSSIVLYTYEYPGHGYSYVQGTINEYFNMFSCRNKKNIHSFWLKKASYLDLCKTQTVLENITEIQGYKATSCKNVSSGICGQSDQDLHCPFKKYSKVPNQIKYLHC